MQTDIQSLKAIFNIINTAPLKCKKVNNKTLTILIKEISFINQSGEVMITQNHQIQSFNNFFKYFTK